MKKLSLALLFLSLAYVAKAQYPEPDFFNEIGIGYGVSFMTQPKLPNYVGTETKTASYATLNYTHYIGYDFSVGLEVGRTHWETSGTQTLAGPENSTIGDIGTTYIFADRALSFLLRFNKVGWHFDDLSFQRSNYYYGVSGGMVFTNQPEEQLIYSQYNGQAGNQNQYISQYNFQSGIGYVVGLQVGYNYFVGRHFGFNADFSPRFMHLFTEDYNQAHQNDQYRLFNFPVTVGIKFRF